MKCSTAAKKMRLIIKPRVIVVRKRKSKGKYSSFIYRLSKQAGHGVRVSRLSKNLVAKGLYPRVAAEAARLSLYNTRRTITTKELQSALRRVLLNLRGPEGPKKMKADD
ncbi:histone H2B 1-like [Spea bombifrons]|uniref:histone H2B 1-like n=1 Tax=Spea bombifrons TaxID=233779 RepID=UPI002349FA2A|nr:histone H2B 1-like [Spea bombifrons]